MQQLQNDFYSAVGQVAGYLPNLVSALLIFAVGYLLSRGLGALLRKGLERTRFNDVVAKRLHPAISTERKPASASAGSALFGVGILVTLAQTAQALRLETLARGINEVLAYVPRVLVAALIVGISVAVARFLADWVSGMTSRWVAGGVRVAIVGLAVFMALDQLGVARNIVNTAFAALVGAAAVAAAIAFGVGNIELARGYSRRLRRQVAGEESPHIISSADEGRAEERRH